MKLSPRRRARRIATAAIALALACGWPAGALGRTATTLPPWARGTLDIHHIATGRGNAALVIGPDGTSILIDAGSVLSASPESLVPARPNDSRRPGEWIARYAQRHLAATGRDAIDYFVLSHLHPDHVGDVNADSPTSRHGEYLLGGVTDVAEVVPIRVVIDRGLPDFAFPSRPHGAYALNYLAFLAHRRNAGAKDERLRPGAADQITLQHARAQFPTFVVRNLAANGEVWTGRGTETVSRLPPAPWPAPGDVPDENSCSIALRVSYGAFDYYTGGDLACDTRFGDQPWRDVETPVALAAGPVEVATANHHAYFDAVGPASVRALRPRAWIISAWHLTHPNIAQLENMLSERLYAGPRGVFATDLAHSTALTCDRFVPQMKSTAGHIVVRVAPGGGEFQIFVTDHRDETDTVTATFGPYPSS